jgi:voltage-gated potassium channel Kch
MREQDLKQSIKDIVFDGEELYSVICTVKSVEFPTCTVQPLDDEIEIDGIRLIADDKEKGIINVPTVESIVIVTFLDASNGFISLLSEIDSIGLRGDAFKGLVKIEDLVSKINRIENKLNSLITKFNSHIHVTTATAGLAPPIGVIGTISPTVTQETAIAPTTTVDDLENKNVTHG